MSNTANTASVATVTIEPFADIVDKYNKADKGDKARIRRNTEKRALDAVASGDFELAQRMQVTVKALGPVKSDIPVDYGQIVLNAAIVASQTKAAIEAFAKEHDITLEWDKLVTTDNWNNADLSAKSDKLVKSLLSVKSDRRSIDGVFERAFESLEVGSVLTVSQVASAGALADYQPGSGAVAARLRGTEPMTLTDNCTLANVEPVWVEKDGSVSEAWTPTARVGARKVA